MERRWVERWTTACTRAWATPDPARLAELFTVDVLHRPDPWADAGKGIADLSEQLGGRVRPGESVHGSVLAVEIETAVVLFEVSHPADPVDPGDPADSVDSGEKRASRLRVLWVLTFASGGRCSRVEEWPAPAR